jgi:hypothetical protein
MNCNYTDDRLIAMLQSDNEEERKDALKYINRRDKEYCIQFMVSKLGQHEWIDDVFVDALVILLKKVREKDFELRASLRTYLCGVCYRQGLTRLRGRNGPSDLDENIENTSWSRPMEEPEKIAWIRVLTCILEDRSRTSENCYDILVLFWFLKLDFETIAKIMDYENEDSARTRKCFCQGILKKEFLKALRDPNDKCNFN